MGQPVGKLLLIMGAVFVILGGLLYVIPNIPWLDKIPGNFRWQKGSVTVYFPLGACIILSVLLSVILHMLSRK